MEFDGLRQINRRIHIYFFQFFIMGKFAFVNKFFRNFGYEIKSTKSSANAEYPIDFNQNEIDVIEECQNFTMISKERMYDLIHAVNYLVKNNISGDIVECGVWKGGAVMIIVKVLLNHGITDREIYLYDTFSGMTKPTKADFNLVRNLHASKIYEDTKNEDTSTNWNNISLDQVKKTVFATNYPKEKFHFIQGRVEETIPNNNHPEISLLRLDTDFYSSTKHELLHLFPLIIKNGVLIIDDYGHYSGSKKAVDEYFSLNKNPFRLHRIDFSGRSGIKL